MPESLAYSLLKPALDLASKTVLETQTYVAALERDAPADRAAEKKLVRLWRKAATAFYGLDGNLSERLQLKAGYWTKPEAWTHQQVLDAGIGLQHVAELTRQLLREGVSPRAVS